MNSRGNYNKFTYEEQELMMGFASGVIAASGKKWHDEWYTVKANLDIHIQTNDETEQVEAFGYRRNMATGACSDEIQLTILTPESRPRAHLYAYSFEPEGFNQVHAHSLDEAKDKVRKRWAGMQILERVKWDSFYVVTNENDYYRTTAMMCD